MTTKKCNGVDLAVQKLLAGEGNMMKTLVKEALQEVLDGEMREFLGAQPHERTEGRKGSRVGYDQCCLMTRIGTSELRMLWDRSGTPTAKRLWWLHWLS